MRMSALRFILALLITANVIVLIRQATPQRKNRDLTETRASFQTVLNGKSFRPDGPPPDPPTNVYQLIRYESGVGQLAAYITPDPGDGKKRPAVIWAHGGLGGIGDFAWRTDDDQSPRAFLNENFVVMCPSWRRENDNPGTYEMFLGEVDDLIAAGKHLAGVPYVDPDRIYVVGYSVGGTLALLASEMTNNFRAAFCIGGVTDLDRVFADGKGYEVTPFDLANRKEVEARNPIAFIDSLQTPMFYFEGGDSWEAPAACQMQLLARRSNRPFHKIIVPRAHHWSVLQPASALIAQKILADSGPRCSITIDVKEARLAYAAMPQPRQENP
jgi:dipeptidyl aminopeptidase/acylaminoacyl peptidase